MHEGGWDESADVTHNKSLNNSISKIINPLKQMNEHNDYQITHSDFVGISNEKIIEREEKEGFDDTDILDLKDFY